MEIFSLKINKDSYSDFFAKITKLSKQKIVFTPNPEILLESLTDKAFKKNLKKADYLVPDGIGLYLAAQLLEIKSRFARVLLLPVFIFNILFRKQGLYTRYGEKICGSDLTEDLLYYAEEKSIKVAIIDLYNPDDTGKCKAQENFSHKLQEEFPDLEFELYIYKNKKEATDDVNTGGAKILFSTLGMKTQEQSVIEIMDKCPNVMLGLGVGSSFDYFIGFQKRSPELMRKLGFEWLYRIFVGPNKLKRMKRIYNAVFVFTYKVIKS